MHRPGPLSDADRKIGAFVAELAEEGACLQMGIGALPDAICAGLEHHRDLGIHTELLSPAKRLARSDDGQACPQAQ